MSTTLSDFVSNVTTRINRSDTTASTRAKVWLVEAFKAICTEYPFVALRNSENDDCTEVIASSNKRTFTFGTSSTIRAIQCVTLTDPDKTNPDGTNYTVRLHPTGFRKLVTNLYGVARAPSEYARYGENTLLLNSVPDKAGYVITVHAWMYPTINATPENTVVVTPMEWDEIITWAAAWRGLQEHLRYDEAALMLKNTIMPLLLPKVTNMKQYLEMQDWDTPLAILQKEYTPVI